MVNQVEKIWLTNADLQTYLGVSIDFIKDLRRDGLLHFYKLRGTIFYKKKDIDKLMESHRVV